MRVRAALSSFRHFSLRLPQTPVDTPHQPCSLSDGSPVPRLALFSQSVRFPPSGLRCPHLGNPTHSHHSCQCPCARLTPSHCRPSCRTQNCLHPTTLGLQSTWGEMTRREVTLSGPQLGPPSRADPSLQKSQLLGIWLLHPFPVFWHCLQSQQLLFQFKGPQRPVPSPLLYQFLCTQVLGDCVPSVIYSTGSHFPQPSLIL